MNLFMTVICRIPIVGWMIAGAVHGD